MHNIASLGAPNQRHEPVKWLSSRDFLLLFSAFGTYFVVGRFNHYLINLRPPAASIWVPAGIALAVVLLCGRRVVPAIFVGTLLLAHSTSVPWLSSLVIASGNTAEVLLASYLIDRFAGGCRAFSQPGDFLRFCLFAGVMATAVSAAVGAAVLTGTRVYGNWQFFHTFVAWWAGDALGVMAVTPFLVLLLSGTHHPLHFRELAEIVTLLIGLTLVCVMSFGPPSVLIDFPETPALLCVPFLVWVAIRFCPLEAAGACMLLCGFATWGSIHGYGPFANKIFLPLPLAAYLCMTTAATLTVAAKVASQREASEHLLENLCRLEQSKDFEISRLTSELDFFRDELTRRVHARSRFRGQPIGVHRPEAQSHPNSSDVLWFLEAETENVLYVSPSYETIWGRSIEDLKRDPHAWLDALLPEDRENAILFVGQDFPGDHAETTYRLQRPDGSIRWIYDRGFVVRGPSGRPVRYVGLASDITELVEQGEVIPVQLERRPAEDLHNGEEGTQTRRKQE